MISRLLLCAPRIWCRSSIRRSSEFVNIRVEHALVCILDDSHFPKAVGESRDCYCDIAQPMRVRVVGSIPFVIKYMI